MSTTSTYPARPTGGPGNNNNNTLDQSSFMGTNVYLYGFLSTLILIFFVSVAVAYKGYRTRILLRQRIDEALAAGVFIPGVSPDDSTSARRRREAGETPIMSEVWIHRNRNWGTNANVDKWDQLQKPLSLQPATQLSNNTNSEPTTPLTLEEWAAQHPFQPGSHSLFFRNRPLRSTLAPQRRPRPPSNEALSRAVSANSPVTSLPIPSDGIRQPPNPTVPPPSSSPLQSQSQSLSLAPNSTLGQPQQPQQPQQQTMDMPLLLGIMIVMPDPTRPQAFSSSHRSSMTSIKGKERDSDPHLYDGDESENGENGNLQLPELVLGCADVPLVLRRSPSTTGSTPVSASVAAAGGS